MSLPSQEPDPPPWHSLHAAEVAAALRTDPELGLRAQEAGERFATHGPNTVSAPRREPWWEEVAESLTEPLVLLLIAVGVVYGLLGEIRDAITILLVIVAVATIEVVNEGRAKRTIEALRSLSAPTALVIRDGQVARLPSRELVHGDLVLLGPGDRVPADLRLVEAVALRVDESSLTGESAAVAKSADAQLPPEAELGDRRNLAYAGTVVTAGKGRGLVVAAGRATELGKIAGLAETTREPRTPLQQHMRELSGWLLWLALGFSVAVPVLGLLLSGRPLQEMVLTGLSLAFATIPEELPILITIVLGIGSYRLSRRRAIVKRLRAAETLGSVSVIGTDKTGTLTENRMRVERLLVGGETVSEVAWGETAARLLGVGVLANDARIAPGPGEAAYLGDPTDTALLRAADRAGLSPAELRGSVMVLDEQPFDDTRRWMATVYERDGERWVAVKGAPEAVVPLCSDEVVGAEVRPLDVARQGELLAQAETMAGQGLRVLAFAEQRLDSAELDAGGAAVRDLTFLGYAGLKDPPRHGVPAALAALNRAGVRVLMLTGDHPATARAIGAEVGIPAERVVAGRELEGVSDESLRALAGDVSVFARIAPEHKLRIVRALAARGEVVAVTGDGVNDAPALREAAIGVAMGRSGTDVAREASDLVLLDDDLSTVTEAIAEGRRLYENLRKAVRYYLAAKVALVGSSLLGVLAQLPVPFAPVQIIVMELFMDLGASTTFVAERPEGDVMARPPRDPRERFMNGSMQAGIFAGGLSLALAVGASYLWAFSQGLGVAEAQTAAFAAWMAGHLVLAAHMRSERQPLLQLGLHTNLPYLAWAAGALSLLIAAAAVPVLRDALHLAPLPFSAWGVALAAGLLAPSWWEVLKWARWGRRGLR